MSRSRERILENLDEMYREAFERAKETQDPAQMATLDFAYRREQLYFEILLDVRDAIEHQWVHDAARSERGGVRAGALGGPVALLAGAPPVSAGGSAAVAVPA